MDFSGVVSSGVLFSVLIFLLVWLGALSLIIFKARRDYRRLLKGVTGSDLKDLWQQHLASLGRMKEETAMLKKETELIKVEGRKHLQRTALIRFNPFADTGGNQSFAATLLDGQGNGLVLSSLHGREGTRVYAKGVTAFTGAGFELSKEEKEVIEHARQA